MLLFFFMVLGLGLNLILPQILRYYIDNFKNNLGLNVFLLISGGYVFTVLLRLVISTLNIYISENIGWTASNSLRVDLTRHCIGLDMDYHKSHNTGEMIERIDGDVRFLANFLSLFVVNFIGNTLLIIGILIMLSLENWTLGLSLGILAPYLICRTQLS
ncbi:MAG: ABC transporter transmembrane domain-containing protein [Bacillota bacterium]